MIQLNHRLQLMTDETIGQQLHGSCFAKYFQQKKKLFPLFRILPMQKSVPPHPQPVIDPKPALRQLPSLPTRQLPTVNNPSKPYFDIQNQEDDSPKEAFSRTNQLFYYQTSSSSTSTNISMTENSDNENNNQQDEEDDDEHDERRRNQSDDYDEQTSPFEYDA